MKGEGVTSYYIQNQCHTLLFRNVIETDSSHIYLQIILFKKNTGVSKFPISSIESSEAI